MNEIWGGIVTVASLVLGVAVIAVLVGSNAKTSQVIQAGGNAFSGAIQAAEAPVTGGGFGGVSLQNPFSSIAG